MAQPRQSTIPLGSFWLAPLLMLLMLLAPIGAAFAVSVNDFPATLPAAEVVDAADVLSRAARADIAHQLEGFRSERVEARLITLNRLDYGLSLEQLGQELLDRWSLPSGPAAGASDHGEDQLLLLLVDTQTKAAAVVASSPLERQLPATLLQSTARSTMAVPLREGNRYRQASVAGLERLATVLRGGEDPGEPQTGEEAAVVSNIPSHEETVQSNGFTWVVVLLVVGSVVPMLTWWVFSR